MPEKITARAVAMIAGVLALVIAIAATLTYCQSQRSKGAQSRAERSQAEAASNSAADAIGTVAASGEASRASEDLTRSNEKDIRNAEGSNDAVNPASRDAGLRALCLRRAYRDDPRCKLLKPAP